MTDYISRDVAVNGLAKIINESDMPDDWNKGMSAAMSALFRIPAADVRLSVMGEWETDVYKYGMERHTCSACKVSCDREYNFCPNCGADMREES